MLTRDWMKTLMALLVAVGLMGFGPVACNTAEGFGEDLESAGEGLQDEASEEDDDWEEEIDD